VISRVGSKKAQEPPGGPEIFQTSRVNTNGNRCWRKRDSGERGAVEEEDLATRFYCPKNKYVRAHAGIGYRRKTMNGVGRRLETDPCEPTVLEILLDKTKTDGVRIRRFPVEPETFGFFMRYASERHYRNASREVRIRTCWRAARVGRRTSFPTRGQRVQILYKI